MPKDHPGPIYLCVNADESEPGTIVNRVQMEDDPHQIVEGIILSAYAAKVTTAYFYIRYEYPLAGNGCKPRSTRPTPQAISARTSSARNYSLDLYIHRGAGAYICGEETGLIESLEGKRAWPRIKPPFPAVEGLFRKPTVVNNVETMACVVHIIDRGVAWFRSIGVPPNPADPRDVGSLGPKLYGISGHVNRPGCYEAPAGHYRAAGDRRVRRRRLEGPQGQGGGPWRSEHRRDDRSGTRHAAWISTAWARSAAWALARPA